MGSPFPKTGGGGHPRTFAEVAFEKRHLAVAFEGQDVGGDAVEEPAVVADDDGAAGEVFQRFFERAQGVDVQVVGGLVQQQDVGACVLSVLARWTRLRSPPESTPTFFCWSAPRKLKLAT